MRLLLFFWLLLSTLYQPIIGSETNDLTQDTFYIQESVEDTEPFIIDNVLLVNKHHPLPASYTPQDLVDIGDNEQMQKEAAQAFLALQKACQVETGIELVPTSGYRSYETQKLLFAKYSQKDGEELADTYSARPGKSEHQTGLAVDIGDRAHIHLSFEKEFADLPAGIWLKDNAYHFGFILRYKEGFEDITGYQFEPWHFRYVGSTLAEELYVREDDVLETYLGDHASYTSSDLNNRYIAYPAVTTIEMDQKPFKMTTYAINNTLYLPLRYLSQSTAHGKHPFHLYVAPETKRVRIIDGASENKDIPSSLDANATNTTVEVQSTAFFRENQTPMYIDSCNIKGVKYVCAKQWVQAMHWQVEKKDNGTLSFQT